MRRQLVLGLLVVVGGLGVVGRLAAQGNVAEIEQVKGNLYVITGGGGNTAALCHRGRRRGGRHQESPSGVTRSWTRSGP